MATLKLITGITAAAIVLAPAAHAEPDVIAELTSTGGSCGAVKAPGEYKCVIDGAKFNVSMSAWQQKDMRQWACDAGYVNTSYRVMTNGTWTIGTDHEGELWRLRSYLSSRGVQSEVRNYCP
jgi:hypothetical protein